MKRNRLILTILAAFAVLLSGCGSDVYPDKGLDINQKFYTPRAGTAEIKSDLSFDIQVPIAGNLPKGAKVKLSDFKLELTGCTLSSGTTFKPEPLTMDNNRLSGVVSIHGSVESDCNLTEYKLTAKESIYQGDNLVGEKVKTILSTNLDPHGNPVGSVDSGSGDNSAGNSAYSLINPSYIEVDTPSKQYAISVDLVDGDRSGVEGKTIKTVVLDQTYGVIGSSSAITGANGKATFAYTAPKNIESLDGTSHSVKFMFVDDNNKTFPANATLYFKKTAGSVEGNVTLPRVVLQPNNVTLSSNSQSVDITVYVLKNLAFYSKGDIKVQLPPKVLNGVDVGKFASFSVPVASDGSATFTYTGPSNLQALIDNGDMGSIFKFYHEEKGKKSVEEDLNIKYQAPSSTIQLRNYRLEIKTNNDDFSLGIPKKSKSFTVSLKSKDSSDSEVPLSSENITSVVIETTNGTIAQLLDGNNLVDSQPITAIGGSATFTLQSKKLSGLVPVRATVTFNDINGEQKVLSKLINVRVLSGPPTAISISYVSTTQDKARAKYIEKLAISATDEYGNNVNTRPNISVGAIAGYAVDGGEASGVETSATKRLFYGLRDIRGGRANGKIVALGANKANFEDNTGSRSEVFKYVNAEGANTDKLVIFGERKNYEAMGKWDIASKPNLHTLELEDNYFGVDREGLYYAVGHNYYQDQCRQDGREWVGSVGSDTFQLDEEGTVTVDYKYDYHLTGKDVLIWVNLDGEQPDTGTKTRIGEVTKHTLRGAGLTKEPSGGFTLEKGTSTLGVFVIWHENAPELYRNAHFGYAIKNGSTCGHSLVDTSNNYDARTCNNGRSGMGVSYITFLLSAPDDKSCTFDIDRIMTSGEF